MTKLTEAQIALIDGILERGERVEIIPVKDGVRIYRIRRNEAKV